MPSTGWNVFVASVVALVVYIAVQAEMVLLGLIAGTLTFVVGWLLGYAINEDLLDSMELSRVVGAGGVTVFAIVWTLLYSEQEYLLGLIVVCLAWFAAWFTSSMGPIKGDTGAMATIDEPRPASDPEPGEPLDLGGPDDTGGTSGSGFLSRLLDFGDDESRAPVGYAPDKPVESRESDVSSHDPAGPSSTPTRDTGPSTESIFGLGIFYEGDPTESSAGSSADGQTAGIDGQPATTDAEDRERTQQRVDEDPSNGTAHTDPPEQDTAPAAADHTRPSATGTVPASDDHSLADSSNSSPNQNPIDEAAFDPPGEETGAGTRQREASESQARSTDNEDPEPASETYNTYRGDDTGGDDTVGSDSDAAADEEESDEPPEDHRVDVDDDDGFIFG